MSHWNYRVFKALPQYEGEDRYELREVHYDEDNAIWGYTGQPATPWGIDADELQWVLNAMLEAFDKPVIDEKELDEYFEELRRREDERSSGD